MKLVTLPIDMDGRRFAVDDVAPDTFDWDEVLKPHLVLTVEIKTSEEAQAVIMAMLGGGAVATPE